METIKKVIKISVLIAIAVIFLNMLFGDQNLGNLWSWKSISIYFFYSFFLTLLNALYFSFFESKIGWENASIKRVFLASTGSVVITLVGYFFCRLVDKTIFNDLGVVEFLETEHIRYYFFPFLFTIIISLFINLLYFYKRIQDQKVTEQKIIAGTVSAKLESLKNQLDPHFLFNSLNVLTSLIEENPEQAQKFTTSLSKIYRYVLEQKEKELVNLKEELNFAQTFINLLKMRFENSIFLEVQENLLTSEAKIVPLSLQLLLENTIKHNVVSQDRPLRIRIYESNNYLMIENNLQKKDVLHQRKGVGLQNIVNRYGHITRRAVFIEQTKDNFTVKLPLLTKQLSIMEDNQYQEQNAYLKARARVKEMKEFYGNLFSYCTVIPFLIFINYFTYWEFQWFWFPLFGWGLGLTIHGFSVFGYGAKWEERKIQELMEKEDQQQKTWK